jgi:hypothetical protein
MVDQRPLGNAITLRLFCSLCVFCVSYVVLCGQNMEHEGQRTTKHKVVIFLIQLPYLTIHKLGIFFRSYWFLLPQLIREQITGRIFFRKQISIADFRRKSTLIMHKNQVPHCGIVFNYIKYVIGYLPQEKNILQNA